MLGRTSRGKLSFHLRDGTITVPRITRGEEGEQQVKKLHGQRGKRHEIMGGEKSIMGLSQSAKGIPEKESGGDGAHPKNHTVTRQKRNNLVVEGKPQETWPKGKRNFESETFKDGLQRPKTAKNHKRRGFSQQNSD